MKIPENQKYTEDHEWILKTEKGHKFGITDYAQLELGDVVFVDVPKVGDEFKKGDTIANVESVKAVSDIYAPVNGKIISVNEKLESNPELINDSPYEDGWIALIEVTDLEQIDQLKDSNSYKSHVEEISK